MHRYYLWLRPIEVPSTACRRNASESADGDVSGGVGICCVGSCALPVLSPLQEDARPVREDVMHAGVFLRPYPLGKGAATVCAAIWAVLSAWVVLTDRRWQCRCILVGRILRPTIGAGLWRAEECRTFRGVDLRPVFLPIAVSSTAHFV